jgi:hypothetical protein
MFKKARRKEARKDLKQRRKMMRHEQEKEEKNIQHIEGKLRPVNKDE